MSLTLSLTVILKVAPPVVPERPEQKSTPANPRHGKSQTPQDPVPSTHAPRQPKPPPLTSGPQTKARTSDIDGGPVVPHVKSLNNDTTPVMARPQTGVSRTIAVSTITQNIKEPVPTQQISSGSSSGTSPSPKKNNKHKKKRVRHKYYLSSSGALTNCDIHRFKHRIIEQPKQGLLHRKVCRLSRVRFRNHVPCCVTWYAERAGLVVCVTQCGFRNTSSRRNSTSAGTTCINSVRDTRAHTITTPLW